MLDFRSTAVRSGLPFDRDNGGRQGGVIELAEQPMTALSAPGTQGAFLILLAVYWASETLFLLRMRAGSDARDRPDDRNSSRVLRILFTVAWVAAFGLSHVPHFSFNSIWVIRAGLVLMCLGELLRWWSIATLGRFFTVNVAIRGAHRVIDAGPYRWVRHPSYTAILLFHLGAGLALDNALSVVGIMLPATLALLNRIRVEESVLQGSLGDAYRAYMKRTKRLVPSVY
jgi:protein-S-isoprenylcysteine O-methyltransferase